MKRFFIFLGCGWLVFQTQGEDLSRLQAVEASAQVQENPPQITLVWPTPERPASAYHIAKRNGDTWSDVATLGGAATGWTDAAVAVGVRYEYRIIKDTTEGYFGDTYITAGIRAPILEDTGKVLLLVRDNVASGAAGELDQLQRDLVLENWEVLRQDVSGSATATQVRSMVQSAWNASGGKLKQVILLGHVAVPYSGAMDPDGHTNHFGAWPADGFYGDVNGTWTDSTANTKVAERDVNWNVPGDGKFDQSEYPTNVEVAVGRVDFFEMTCYANKPAARSELDLTRQYLNKDHQFRSGQWQISRRGLVLDNFGLRDTNGVSATAWRNFAAFFGASANGNMALDTYFPRLTTESALFTWGAGGGSYYYSSGIGTSDDFATKDVNVVFSLWLGSYFGDWNNESNWLKAALGSGKILVSIYSGIPHSLLHGMALGGTIGESFLLTENNGFRDVYLPDTQGTHQAHQALLGDPTLRMWPRGAVGSFGAVGAAGKANLSWAIPSGGGFVGVHVYRGSSANGPFARITSSPVTGTTFSDVVAAGTYSYLARPVYLESNGSGSFYDLGQGALAANVTVTPANDPPPNPPSLSIVRSAPTKITLTVTSDAGRQVIVEYSDVFGSWTELTRVNGTGPAISLEAPLDAVQRRIYRARY